MSSMNKDLEQKLVDRLGKTIISIGEKSTRGCVLYGNYEPKISVELLRNKI